MKSPDYFSSPRLPNSNKLGEKATAMAMRCSLRNLEQIQSRILQRIADLESSLSISAGHRSCTAVGGETTTTESRLSTILRSLGAKDFAFKRVASDYYDRSIEERREILGAASVDHLCKSIVLVNTQAAANVIDCSNRNNSKYYVVVIQYTARLNAENIRNFLYSLNNQKIAKKRFNWRLAPEEDSMALTGFVHNAVTCVGMQTDIPTCIAGEFQTTSNFGRVNTSTTKLCSCRQLTDHDTSWILLGPGYIYWTPI